MRVSLVLSYVMQNSDLLKRADDVLQRTLGAVRHIDTKANFLLGISSVLFAYTYSNIAGSATLAPLMILNVSSGFSMLFSLFTIQPPRCIRSKGQELRIMFPGHISGFVSQEEFTKAFLESARDEKTMFEEISKEIYNLSRFYFALKYKLFAISRNILIAGVLVSMIVYCVT